MDGQEERLAPALQDLYLRLSQEQMRREEERRVFQQQWLGELLQSLRQQVEEVCGAVKRLQLDVVPEQGAAARRMAEELSARMTALGDELAALKGEWQRGREQRGRPDQRLREDLRRTLEQARGEEGAAREEERQALLASLRQLNEEQIAACSRVMEQAFAAQSQPAKAALENESPALREEWRERLVALKQLLHGPLAHLPSELQELRRAVEAGAKAPAWPEEAREAISRLAQIAASWERWPEALAQALNDLEERMERKRPSGAETVSEPVLAPPPAWPAEAQEAQRDLIRRLEEIKAGQGESAAALRALAQPLGPRAAGEREALRGLLGEERNLLQGQWRQELAGAVERIERRLAEGLPQRSSESKPPAEKIPFERRRAAAEPIPPPPRRRAWEYGVAGALFLLILFSPWLAHWLLAPPSRESTRFSALHVPAESAGPLPAPGLDIADGSSQKNESADFSGEAPWGSFVLLLVNGQEKALRFIENKRFEFKQIELGAGEWMLQVVAFDANGRSAVSDTIRLTVEAALPPLAYVGTANSIAGGPAERREMALTFDAGSNDREVQAVLDILRAEKMPATIFLTGQFIEKYPRLVRHMIDDGHQLGNHTYDHPHLTSYEENGLHQTAKGVDRHFLLQQLQRTEAIFQRVTGRHLAPYWRAPYGEFNQEIAAWAAAAGYKHVHWTKRGSRALDSLSWITDRRHPLYRTAPQMRDYFLRFEEQSGQKLNGGIALFHLASDRERDSQLQILPDLIRGLRRRGIKLVTVSELVRPNG